MLRYRLRTLLLAMVAAAIFFGGYRLGWQHGRDSRFAADFRSLDRMTPATNSARC